MNKSPLSIVTRVLNNARIKPETPALLTADKIVTYRMLAASILSVQKRLLDLGLDMQRPVALDIEHPTRHMIVALAAMNAGLPTLSLQPGNREFDALDPQAVLADETDNGRTAPTLVVNDDWFTSAPAPRGPSSDPRQLCRITVTSGSTGKPKPLAHCEETIWRRMEDRLPRPLPEVSRCLCLPGLFTHFGFTAALLPLCLGKTTVFAQSYEEAIRLIDLYRIDHAIGSPAQFAGLLDGLSAAPLPTSSLRYLLSGGGPLVPKLIANARAHLGAQIIDVYSSTEGGPAAMAAGQFLLDRANELSFVPTAPVRCVNRDGSSTDGEGLVEVYSRAPSAPYRPGQPYVMPQPQWVRTGDVGRMEHSGALTILGRANDIANAGGRKIDARAIEQVLMELPGMEDVGVVISDQESYASEIWVALVSNRVPDIKAVSMSIATAFNGLQLDRIVRLPKLPRSSLGKLQSDELRQTIRAMPQSNDRA